MIVFVEKLQENILQYDRKIVILHFIGRIFY